MPQRNPRKRTMSRASRASTASIHSVATQPNMDQQALMAHHNAFQEQWAAAEHGPTRDMTPVVQPMQAGDMMLRPASQMQGAQMQNAQSFSMDAGIHSAVGPAMSYQHSNMHHAVPSESFGANASFTDADSQMMDQDEADEAEPVVAPRATGSKSGSGKIGANNELEMRQLFQANKDRTLVDVAKELHGNERGPNSERTRQVFAMLWLDGVCSKGKGSVPRARVYSNYATKCAKEKIAVLNPASFGKLVRVLFPGLKTRRLGVRGLSKYHYVNFTLIDDQPEPKPQSQSILPLPDSGTFSQQSINPAQSPTINTQHSALPSPTVAQQLDRQTNMRPATVREVFLFDQPDMASSNAKVIVRQAVYSEADEHFDVTEDLVLPHIDPFLPPKTDPDAAKSLSALYLSHCTSLVECIRFCKPKPFFHLYTAFQGTLTMPVQKLFCHPDMAQWIEQCDFVLYQRMARIVFSITLQVIPPPVLDSLQTIMEQLVSHVRESFRGQPQHVVAAKEAPAAIFASLLDRALRANLTAHAAANMLSLSDNRDQMYIDWIEKTNPRKLAECTDYWVADKVVDLILEEMRDLLCPVNVPWEIEGPSPYGQALLRKGGSAHVLEPTGDNGLDVIGRWYSFLRSLPRRFPRASADLLVRCVEAIGMRVLRDLTIKQGRSFGSWWVLKCWIDEMMYYMMDFGGFMETKSTLTHGSRAVSKTSANDISQQGSRLGSSSDDFGMSRLSQPQPDSAPFPTQLEAQPGAQASRAQSEVHGQDTLQPPPPAPMNPDDSGIELAIGIRTPEEEFPQEYEKYGFDQNDNHPF
ncbi:RFX DNA-binding domain-containing protein [Hypoxylon rubiginosum]|uniref:RFX DNA-binding domain-containing protein n=1 Tax=Hypoxylon rubiginosum TaxID=110542 RepID=A0ACC0CLM6_9PEZI|nr:RFX DNA-binding domain-containing protein [Hypoxylon rubiginosum]